MFKTVRDLSGSVGALVLGLQHVSAILGKVSNQWDSQGPLEERVAQMERDRDQWEARMEAEMMRADSTFKSARAAEERGKTVLRNAEAVAGSDEGEDGIPAEYLELLRGNAEASAAEGVQPVPAPVEVGRQNAALVAKFGGAG